MKYALVTGGSGDIGRQICLKVALDHNYHVLVNYFSNNGGAIETVKQIKDLGGSAETIHFDVTNFNEVKNALDEWIKINNDAVIELLVNNAGKIKDGLFMMMDEKNWDTVVDIKLKGFYNVTRNLIQKMLLNRYGRIINISSFIGVNGQQGQVNYAAANGGLIAATKTLAKEVGKRNVTVNTIAPGFIYSEMTKNLPETEIKKFIPLNRFGTAEEVADLVSFLASKKASYITGEVININGGL